MVNDKGSVALHLKKLKSQVTDDSVNIWNIFNVAIIKTLSEFDDK